jgi:hypothetical protein
VAIRENMTGPADEKWKADQFVNENAKLVPLGLPADTRLETDDDVARALEQVSAGRA